MIIWITGIVVFGFICAIMLWVNSKRKLLMGWTYHNAQKEKSNG